MDLRALPGGDLVGEGLEDLTRGELTAHALLVLVGAPRLRMLGLTVPESAVSRPEDQLYELLARSDQDSAHSRYNALLRRLVSFERALACERRGPAQAAGVKPVGASLARRAEAIQRQRAFGVRHGQRQDVIGEQVVE